MAHCWQCGAAVHPRSGTSPIPRHKAGADWCTGSGQPMCYVRHAHPHAADLEAMADVIEPWLPYSTIPGRYDAVVVAQALADAGWRKVAD